MKSYIAVKAFFSYTARIKAAFWFTAAVFAVSDVILAVVPWLIGQLASSLTANEGTIVLWTALLIAASVGHDILWRTGEILYVYKINPHKHRIDDAVFSAVINQPYSYFVDKFTGKVSSYANTLGREFREIMANFHYQYINLVVSLPLIAAVMFTVNVYTGVIFVVSLILMLVAGRLLLRASAAAERKFTDEYSSMEGLVVDAVANFVSVKAFGNERRETKALQEKRNRLVTLAHTSYLKSIYFWGAMSLFVRWIIWPSTFILNVYLFTQGRIDLAQMATFLAAIVIFTSFIWEVVWNISQLNIQLARVQEAYQYLFGSRNIFKDPPPETVKPLPKEAFKHSLELHNLSFAYPDKPELEVLSDINLTIRQSEKIGIVGHSGGGKSTLLKLLLGYYLPSGGEVLLDEQPVDTRSLVELTAYVPQDTSVFHRSIRDNIAYGKQDASEAEILAAAKHAQAHEFVVNLENGYDTLVGERGIKLSGGQRQRIAIARAILKDAPLLMLDEATSALDSESERLIQAALWKLMEGRTALVIAHRLSTIQKMDRIVVLERGTIVEQGTHQELLAKKGVYAKLWSHQSGGFIEE